MDREKKDQLPAMQVGFIDSICLPVYNVSVSFFCHVKPLSSFPHRTTVNNIHLYINDSSVGLYYLIREH